VVHDLKRLVPEKTRKTTIEKKTHTFFFVRKTSLLTLTVLSEFATSTIKSIV
jgi:hypothetical protein